MRACKRFVLHFSLLVTSINVQGMSFSKQTKQKTKLFTLYDFFIALLSCQRISNNENGCGGNCYFYYSQSIVWQSYTVSAFPELQLPKRGAVLQRQNNL